MQDESRTDSKRLKKIKMKIHESKWLKVDLCKAGKGEPFHWKPLQVPHRKSMAEMRYWENETYIGTHSFVTHFIQIFFLWFVIGVEIKEEVLSSSKYTRYESTHFYSIEEAFNKKD